MCVLFSLKDEDKISHYCIIVLGISTLGTSVLLWWLYKELAKHFSGKDKYDLEGAYVCMYMHKICDLACKNRLSEHKKLPILACLLCHILNNYLYYCNIIFITTAEFNGLSSAAYKNGIVHSERKMLVKI